ncbi:MAG: tRNA (adenosine(37)-N6)-threonylcarbamoyltransferase complex transferase subunit TsaD [Deltaproteobacteria bacterium]|nr:tRNA (adenosine(37)-N6)-threonylcarbamoyltransferase complex transferase subunit TsaD [Deltaproteobacteria bacterium]
MTLLAIETSCDDTCAAVLGAENRVLSSIVSSQVALHELYGGIVPELASRRHCENIRWVVEQALLKARIPMEEIEAVCVTKGPGLVGSLLVGVAYAKSLAYAREIALIGVNHVEGHLLSPLLTNPDLTFPFIGLVVSGGHSSLYLARGWHDYELLGRTIDDAAGEAFDKVARMLDLGFPGGPVIEKRARAGDPSAIKLPRAWLGRESLDFSFSGLKTAVRTVLERQTETSEAFVSDLAASFQEAVTDVLVRKTLIAAERYEVKRVTLAGGVSCNGYLRQRMSDATRSQGVDFFLAPPEFCTDNAAMIGLVGRRRLAAGLTDDLTLNPSSRLPL